MNALLGKLLVTTLTVAALQGQILYKIDTFAGSGEFSFTAEGSLAAEARMVSPIAAAVAPTGDVYFTESFFHQIFRVGADGRIHRFAGTGEVGSSGDGGPALSATLDRPFGLDVDAAGVVYFCDANTHRIRSIGLDGIIRTVAGTGVAASTGDGSLAVAAQIITPRDVAIDRTRNILYFSEVTGSRVRKIDLSTGVVSLVAGTGVAGSAGDGGPAISAQLNQPVGLGLASDGALLIADRANAKVRRITLAGIITTVAGTGVAGVGGDGGAATAAQLLSPNDVLGNPDGSFLIADLGVKARMVNAGGIISVFGDPSLNGSNFLVRTADDAIISVVGTRRLVRFKSGATTAFAGFLAQDGIGDGGQAEQAKILAPHGVAVNKLGEVFVGDALDVRIRGINSANVIRTAGQGTLGVGLATDSQSRLHSTAGATVLRFTPQGGVAATVAGSGAVGSSGDGGPATAATLTNALALAFDADDNLYIADVLAHRVRRVAAATGTISTVAGTGVAGYSGDGGAASAAQLNSPNGLAVGPDGTLYIADKENNRVRAVKNGVIRTFAGNGLTGVIGDGIPAVDAEVGGPFYVAADAGGSVYITSGQVVRKVFPDGIIRTIGGTVSEGGFSGDGGPATSAEMSTPTGIAVDSDGVVYVADQLNGRVRSLEPVDFFAEGVVNGASFKSPISPGGIASIFGVDIGPEPPAYGNFDENLRLETTVGGVQVLFNDVAAPIFFASSGQLNVQAPYEIAGSPTATITIVKNGVELSSAVVPVEASGPGIFAVSGGTGQAVALNQDGSLNSAGNPEQPGRVIVLYVTGGGVKTPALGTGEISTAPFPTPVLEVEVKINGVAAPVQFAAAAPGFVGLMQINVVVPAGIPPGGAIPVEVRVGERSSPEGTTIAVAP